MGLQNREGALYYATGIDTTGLSQGRQQSIGILRGMSSQISRMDIFAGLAISGGIAFKRLAIDAKKFSQEFEQSMREVLTISAALQGDFEGYSDMIVDMSRELPQSANALAKAYYQIVSAGYDGAAGLELLEQASRAAIGGVTDVTTAADGMTTVLNAWNLSARESTTVADMFFTAVRLGKTTFGEMSASISQAAPLAAAYGVSFNEIAAAIASITKQGTPTTVAMTQIRQALIAVNKVLGQGWSDAFSFQEAMQEVADRAKTSGKDLKEFVGEIEGVLAILATTGKNAKGAADDLQAIADSAGAADKAYTDMAQSAINQSKNLKNNIDAALKPLGDWMSQKSTGFARAMNEAFASGQVEKYAEFVKIATVSLAAYALTANGAALSTSILNKAMGLAAASMSKLRLAFASNPVGMIAVGLTAAVTAFTAYNKKVDKSTQVSAKLTESISSDIFSLNALFTKLKTAEKGTEDWNRARELINTRYGPYLKNLIDEKTALEDIEKAQKNVTEAMVANAGLKVYREQLSSELDKYSREFEKKMGEFTQVFTQMKGVDRLPDFIGAINEAIDKEIKAGNGKIERGMLERSQIAMDVYNEFLYDISQQTGFVKYDPKSFTNAFLDIAQLKAEGKPYTDYLQGMVDTWTGMLSEFNKTTGGAGDAGGGDGSDPATLNYYDNLLKKITETEDQLKDLAGAQGEMDLVAIASKKELLQQYTAELQAIELLLGLREKEKQEAAKQGPAGSILGIRQEIEALNQQYVEATTQAARESLKAQIEAKEQELDVIQGVIKQEVKLYEDYYRTIENKGFRWLQTELEQLKTLRDAKKQAFSAGGDLSEAEKKKIIEDLDEIQGKIKSIESEIRNNLRDSAQIVGDVFSSISRALAKTDEHTAKMVDNIGKAVDGMFKIGMGISSSNPVEAVGGIISFIESMIALQEASIEKYKEFAAELEKINILIDRQNHLIQTNRTGDKADQIREMIRLYKEEAEILKEKIEFEKRVDRSKEMDRLFGFIKLNFKSKVPELEQALEELNRVIEAWGLELGDTLAGGVTQADIAGIIADEFAAARGEVVDFGNITKRILQDAVLSAFQAEIMQEGLSVIQDYLGNVLGDGVISESEQQGFEDMVAKFGEQWQDVADSLNLSGIFSETTEDVNSLSGAIRRSLTEETGGIIAGTMNALRLDVREMKGIQFEMVGHLEQITINTSHNYRLNSILTELQGLRSDFKNNA